MLGPKKFGAKKIFGFENFVVVVLVITWTPLFLPENFFDHQFLHQIFFGQIIFWSKIILDNVFWPKFLDYQNSVTTNQIGFDTIEINLVKYY